MMVVTSIFCTVCEICSNVIIQVRNLINITAIHASARLYLAGQHAVADPEGCFGCPGTNPRGTNPRGTARQELGRSRSIARAVCSTVLHVYAVRVIAKITLCVPSPWTFRLHSEDLFVQPCRNESRSETRLVVDQSLLISLPHHQRGSDGTPPDGRSGSAAGMVPSLTVPLTETLELARVAYQGGENVLPQTYTIDDCCRDI